MTEKIACMIWCGECYQTNFAEVHMWVWSGQAVVRGGRLRVPVRCGSCDREISPGERVDTVTLHSGLMAASEWAAEFVVFGVRADDECDAMAEGE